MAGLLDTLGIDDPETLGLLSLGTRLMSTPGKFLPAVGIAGQGALQDFAEARRQALVRRQGDLQGKLTDAQMRTIEAQLKTLAREEADREKIVAAAQARRLTPGQAAVSANGGPTTAAAMAMPSTAPGFDWRGFSDDVAGIDPMKALLINQALRKEDPKVKEVTPMTDPATGKLVNVVTFDNGTTRVLPYGVKPDIALQGLGNKMVAIDKNAAAGGQSWDIGTSPDARLRATTDVNVANITDKRERDLAGTRVTYQTMPDGTMRALPTQLVGPQATVSGIPVASGSKDSIASEKVKEILDKAEPLLAGSTGSYGGAALDMLGQVFGMATDGSINVGRLKVLEGKLMLAQPRLEGPQSDSDKLLYRQMAAQIGDPTVPNAVKAAAIDTLRKITGSYDPVTGRRLHNDPINPPGPTLNPKLNPGVLNYDPSQFEVIGIKR